MDTKDGQERHDSSVEGPRIPRRGFLIWSALAATAAACGRIMTDATVVRTDVVSTFAGYPFPAYVPPGYELFLEQDNRPDGFRDALTQVALVYKGPRAPTSIIPSGTRYPLLLFATTSLNSSLTCTESREAVPYPLTLPTGKTVTAKYFDGIWQPVREYNAEGKRVPGHLPLKLEWSVLNFHQMVYQCGEYQIGIRASRLCGIQFDEMVKVASSVTVPA